MREQKFHIYLDSQDIEMQTVYFRGCYDGIGYLKKAGIL